MFMLIARHGESTWNAEEKFMGPEVDPPLSKKGIKQAGKLAKRLKTKKLEVIYSSGQLRAIETAQSVNRWHKLKIIKRKEFNEQSFGVLLGMKRHELPPSMQKIYLKTRADPKFRIPRGESFNDVVRRVKPLLREITRKYRGTVLIVAHGRVLRAIVHILAKKSFTELMSNRTKNCSLTEIEIKNGKGRLIKYEDYSHMEAY